MEVKLVHPDDPEKKVVTATDEQQVAAYRKHGFVDEAESKAAEASKTEEATSQSGLQAKLEATEKELAETKEALKKAKAESKAAKSTKSAPGANSEETE